MIFRTTYPASKKLLLDRVSELDIFLLFCSDFKAVNIPFRSPIVIGDNINSSNKAACINLKGGSFLFRDFRIGETYNAIGFAMFMTGMRYNDVVQWLCDRFGIATDNSNDKVPVVRQLSTEQLSSVIEEKRSPSIEVKYVPWELGSINFWIKHGWRPEMLDKAQIRPIDRFWLTIEGEYRKEYNGAILGPISFSFDFGEYDGEFKRKIYSPYAKQKWIKWRTNAGKEIIQGLNTINSHLDTLYIVSSLKDCGPYWTLLGHPCAIAPLSESVGFSIEQVRMMRQISNRQIIWYDNDLVGRQNAQKQANLYGFEWKYNPIGSPKDQSDYVYERGLNEFNKLIK